MDVFEQRLDLLYIQYDRNLLTFGALSHPRNRIPVMPFPAHRVIEDRMHDVANFRLAAIRQGQ
ncbi:MAG: hypothetical protein ACREDL_24655 [Bradyrhizobium sp.]